MTWLKKIFGRKQAGPEQPGPDDLLDMVRLSPLFKGVPETKIREMLTQSAAFPYREGETVFNVGGEGDFYYIVLDGMVSIARPQPGDNEPRVVAVFAPGHSFGEEALISNATRTAAATMLSDGMLLCVPKTAFIDYLMVSLVNSYTPLDAQRKVNTGALWLDVRSDTEHRRSHLPGSMSLPIEKLRDGTSDLDKGKSYVCYCDTGRRSTTAAYLLKQNGYDVGVLQGGLNQLDRQQKKR